MRMRTQGRISVAAILLTVVISVAGCRSSLPAPEQTYGGWPTFLPSPTRAANQTLPGSQASPALVSQGGTVLAQLPEGGTVFVTITGPEVPGQGLPEPPPTTTCTWTVVFSGGTVDVALDLADFATQDYNGVVYHPQFIPGRSTPPASLPAGQSVSFELRTVMPIGEGAIQWAPDGKIPVATWDFIVEND